MDAPFGFEMSLISLPLSGQLHYYLRLPSERKSIGLLKERANEKNRQMCKETPHPAADGVVFCELARYLR